MDVNALRRLLQSGGVTEDALRGMTLSGSFDGGGATSSFDPSRPDPSISTDPVALARALQMGQLTREDVDRMGPTNPLAKLLQTIPQQDQNYGDQPSRTGEQVQNALRAYMDAGDQPERAAMQLRPQEAQDLSGYGTADQPSRTMDRYALPPTTLGQNFPDQVSRNNEQLSRNNPQVQETDPYAQPGGPMRLNTMRTETGPNAGHVISLDFTGANGQQGQGGGQGRMMQVIGVGNGTTVNLPPEQMNGKPNIDLSRAPVDVMGAKAYYSKDEPGVAYVMGPNGTKKVILGYDMQGSMALNKYNLDQQKTQQEIAHSQEQVRASQANNPEVGSAGGPGLAGDELLKSLDPGTAGLVKAYAEGRMAFPGGAAMRSPRMMQLLQLVSAYDPNFDAKDFNTRNKAQIGFTSGKQGDAVRAADQAIAHAGALSGDIDALNNFNGVMTPLNSIVNPVESAFGDPRQGRFKQNAMALSSELRKVFAGAGGGSLSELQSWESGLPLNASQEQQKQYLAKGMDLLQGGINALNDQYQRAMGPRANIRDLLSPTAKAALEKLETGGQASQPQASNAPQTSDLQSPPNPAQYAGKRMQTPDGTIYKSNGSSWVRVG